MNWLPFTEHEINKIERSQYGIVWLKKTDNSERKEIDISLGIFGLLSSIKENEKNENSITYTGFKYRIMSYDEAKSILSKEE